MRKNFPVALAAPGKFLFETASVWVLKPGKVCPRAVRHCLWFRTLSVLLFVAILAQALLALVRGNLMSFTFFSARHTASKVMSYEL